MCEAKVPAPGWTPERAEEYGVAFAAQLGKLLRGLRAGRGLSLDDVMEASDGRWNRITMSMYERAERGIPVGKLDALARFYGSDARTLARDAAVAARVQLVQVRQAAMAGV